MCGIAGFSGTFPESLLASMNAKQAHRGPDGQGTWYNTDDNIGLAHTRLSIIDTSQNGKQPMWDAGKKVIISYNGEIYNYRELKKLLEGKGYRFVNKTDTEVLCNLYLCYGPEVMLQKLNGIFSFALWDCKKKTLFLARDGYGVKPLYYCECKDGFIFASELKSILCHRSIDKTLNTSALLFSLNYLWTPAPHTMLRETKKAKPGSAFIVENGRIKKEWIWHLIPVGLNTAYNTDEHEIAEKTFTYIEQAVKRQMVADVPVGTFLSGGLDSSAISYFAQKFTEHGKLNCFSIDFSDARFKSEGFADDLPYARSVAKQIGAKLNVITVGANLIEGLEDMVYHLDEPQSDPAPLNLYMICTLAKDMGIKVLLSGTGGDDVFSGYRRHYALYLERYWKWLPLFVRSGIAHVARGIPTKNAFLRRVSRGYRFASLSNNERIESYFRWIDPEVEKKLLLQDVYDVAQKTVSPLLENLSGLPSQCSTLEKMLYLEKMHFLADHNLNYADKMSMATGVEVRVPFLDPELIQFASTIPDQYKQHKNIGKYIFKKSMEKIFPHDIIHRPKTGFGAPLRSWLHTDLKDMVSDTLSKKSINNRGIFNYNAVHNLIQNDQKGNVDGAYTILSLLVIELWCRLFVDGKMDSYSTTYRT